MKDYWLSFIVFATFFVGLSCTTTRVSEWAALDDAGSADCDPWPLKEEDLRIDRLLAHNSRPGVVFAASTQRTGQKLHYAIPYEDEPDLDSGDVTSLQFGRRGLLIGGIQFNGSLFALVAQNQEEKTLIELRDIKRNVVRHQLENLGEEYTDGFAVETPTGFWLALKRDDHSYRLVYVAQTTDAKLKYRTVSLRLVDRPHLFAKGASQIRVVHRKDKQTDPGKPEIAIHDIDNKGKIDAVGSVKLPLSAELESWTVSARGDELVFAFVEGDSLVGNAVLRVVSYAPTAANPLRQQWQAEASVQDTHVSDPLLLQAGGKMRLFILQWVDAESTVAQFDVSEGKLSKPSLSGIFQPGSRIQQIFAADDLSEPYIVTRTKDDTSWKFELCQLED